MNTLMINYFVYFLFFVNFVVNNCQQFNGEDISNNSPLIDQYSKSIRQKDGSDLLLKCHNYDNLKKHKHGNEISWDFKPCEVTYKDIHCNEDGIYDLNNDDKTWIKINNIEKKILDIRHTNVSNSGIYRCLNNYRVLQVYIVEIVDDSRIDPPKIMSIHATNTSVQESADVTLQCKIKSTILPNVFWFKSCNLSRCEIRDNDICHCLVAHPPYSNPSENIYLSKITIKAKKGDSGLYSCIAINEFGRDCKNITIRVLSNSDSSKSSLFLLLSNSDSSQTSLLLLFFIPALLILIPVTCSIWLCYFRKKKKNMEKKFNKQFEKPLV